MVSEVDRRPERRLHHEAGRRVHRTGRAAVLRRRRGADGRSYATNKLFDVTIPVGPKTRLSYKIFPEFTGGDGRYPSTYAAVDLHFTDGSYLSGRSPARPARLPAHGRRSGRLEGALRRPVEPGAGRPRHRRARQDDRPHPARVRQPAGHRGDPVPGLARRHRRRDGRAGVDRRLEADQLRRHPTGHQLARRFLARQQPADHRGAERLQLLHPGDRRDLRLVGVRVPPDNNAANLPMLQGLAISHEPSPWMGDRNQMSGHAGRPAAALTGPPSGARSPFSHDDEIARPDSTGSRFRTA